jgi:hypothetical protein
VADRFDVKADRIIHETLDGEVVAIDLGSGTYYSMRGTAGVIWEAVAAGSTLDEITGRVAAAYATAGGDVRTSVLGFLERLEARGLIVRSEVGGGREDAGAAGAGSDSPPYEEPRLEVFTDMEDLILLDPVHDVDPEKGWPHPIDREQA